MADSKKGSSSKQGANELCPQCGGRKTVAWGTGEVRCGLCGGTGKVRPGQVKP